MCIKNATKNTIVEEHAWLADSFWKRLKGLLGTKSLERGYGVVIKPCSSVHTFGMSYPIDVLFVDAHDRIIKIVVGMAGGRGSMALGSSYVIELPKGTVQQAVCTIGDILILK